MTKKFIRTVVAAAFIAAAGAGILGATGAVGNSSDGKTLADPGWHAATAQVATTQGDPGWWSEEA